MAKFWMFWPNIIKVGVRLMRFVLFRQHKPGPSEMLPPLKLREFVGKGDFLEIGRAFLSEIERSCELHPDAKILDLGCGSGRIAIPFTQYLSEQGRYKGFDVSPACIRHCQRKIGRAYPNFHFLLADINNSLYNPRGRYRAEEYRFPYDDGEFDIAVAGSLFTHLLPSAAGHYIAEIARVLRPGGWSLSTFFLLDETARKKVAEGKSSIPFVLHDNCLVADPAVPESAVCFELDFILSLYARYGLDPGDQISYGFWSGRQTTYAGYQDMIVARKVA